MRGSGDEKFDCFLIGINYRYALTWVYNVVIDLAEESIEGFGLVFVLDQPGSGAKITRIRLCRARSGALAGKRLPDRPGEMCHSRGSCKAWLLNRPSSVEGCLGRQVHHSSLGSPDHCTQGRYRPPRFNLGL